MYGMKIIVQKTRVKLPSKEVLEDEGWVLPEDSKFDFILDDDGNMLGAKDWAWTMVSWLNLDDSIDGIFDHARTKGA